MFLNTWNEHIETDELSSAERRDFGQPTAGTRQASTSSPSLTSEPIQA